MAHNVANIMKIAYGKNKKSLVLDLDNTLWGEALIGGMTVRKIWKLDRKRIWDRFMRISESYVKSLKDYGVMLNVASKNEEENALAGLNHPASVEAGGFLIVAGQTGSRKSRNILEIALS